MIISHNFNWLHPETWEQRGTESWADVMVVSRSKTATLSLAFKRVWWQNRSPETHKRGPFVLSCIQTSFVAFKTPVNIPLSGPASVQRVEF